MPAVGPEYLGCPGMCTIRVVKLLLKLFIVWTSTYYCNFVTYPMRALLMLGFKLYEDFW